MTEYTELIINQPNSTELQISDCYDTMIHAFDRVHIFRTEPEMRGGILNPVSYPTPDSKYWQAVRELTVMSENLAENEFALREANINLALLKLDLDEIGTETKRDNLLRDQKQVEIDRAEFNRAQIKREINRRRGEIVNWTQIIRELEPQLACGTTDPGRHQPISYIIEFGQKLMVAAESGDHEVGENNLSKLLGMIAEVKRVGRIDELRTMLETNHGLRDFLGDQIKED